MTTKEIYIWHRLQHAASKILRNLKVDIFIFIKQKPFTYFYHNMSTSRSNCYYVISQTSSYPITLILCDLHLTSPVICILPEYVQNKWLRMKYYTTINATDTNRCYSTKRTDAKLV